LLLAVKAAAPHLGQIALLCGGAIGCWP
jgi:hypothetical protein